MEKSKSSSVAQSLFKVRSAYAKGTASYNSVRSSLKSNLKNLAKNSAQSKDSNDASSVGAVCHQNNQESRDTSPCEPSVVLGNAAELVTKKGPFDPSRFSAKTAIK